MRGIDTIDEFTAWLDRPEREAAAIQALDLRPYATRLAHTALPGSLFLACELPLKTAGALVATGAVVMPDSPHLGMEFTVHRSRLYSAEELYEGYDPTVPETFEATPDQRIYQEFVRNGPTRPDLATAMCRALHDQSMTSALDELLEGRRVVAIMGGHKLERSSPWYREVVVLAKALSELDYLVASGGGPGAMEATHLGAWLAGRPDRVIDEVLSGAFVRRPADAEPNREYADSDWLARAFQVRERWPRVSDAISVGIPTWLYGHEPPTPFATHLAKYFANSVREDGVLAVANHGVVFARGSAGTTQEVFQDACQNHYGTQGSRAPMILMDRDYWTEVRPVWPLLHTVSRDEIYGDLVQIVDTADEALALLQRFQISWYRVSMDPCVQFESDLRRVLRLGSNWTLNHARRYGPDALVSAAAALEVELDASPVCGPAVTLVTDWLFAIGDDDWIDRDRAAAVLPALLGDATAERHPGALVLAVEDGVTVWTASLAD